ncbi:hypothetical protein AVEN_136548-1, partial [Araneus ventricosus]
ALHRVLVVIKAHASRGLIFRGSNEIFGWNNNGNYMMMMVTVSAFDSFLADHIERLENPGSGQTSYLSSSICEEFIESSKYHSLFEGSTPDITYVDQLPFILRSVVEIEEIVKEID